MTEQPRAARVVLSYRETGAEILSVDLLDGPPPPARLDLPDRAAGAWVEVHPPGGGVAFVAALHPPAIGAEYVDAGGELARHRGRAQLHTQALELPWYGEGTRIVIRESDGSVTSRNGARGIAALTLEPTGVRGDGPAPVLVRRFGHDNPRALRLLFVPEAFLEAELPRFIAAVNGCLDAIEAVKPFGAMKRAIMPLYVPLASKQSGISHKAGRTVFRGKFRSAAADERLIEVDQRRVAKEVSRSAARVPAQAIVIVNTLRYGGSGGAAAVVSCDPVSMAGVLVHELGHSRFSLADEYSAASGWPTDGKPLADNVSATADRATLKWGGRVAATTPLPTPATFPGLPLGAYEGAMYRDTGAYRPAFDCRMRNILAAFCPVCSAEIEGDLSRFL